MRAGQVCHDAVPTLYLTSRDLAQLLQVSEKSIARWAQQDASMPVTRLGSKLMRFERQAIEEWLRSRTQGRAHQRHKKR